MKFPRLLLIAACYLAATLVQLRAEAVRLLERASEGAFPLVSGDRAARLITDPGDFKVVGIATQCLADDIERITGLKSDATGKSAVIIGTLGKNPLIDRLIAEKKIDVSAIRGKWESFVVASVRDPLPGVAQGLVIAGSDRRGTAFGVFDLCETIGVSPWVWWADVAPTRRDSLFLSPGTRVQGPPSVKYRGIFINDEDWGLQPWAEKTFEPEKGDIGPKTYAKVCELLLRLKANYLWPAMHPSTKAFNNFPENKIVADDHAIVMGSSHCEPLLRNNVGEWDEARGDWNYQTNAEGVRNYWEERVKESGRFENTYTLGMRGVHDGKMPFKGTPEGKVNLLEKIISDQRGLLARHVNPELERVPQIFIPYKEVLDLYQQGLKVPDDVTLVWPDDNHGYIRRLSTPEEQKRRGGSGIYYHLSYWGAPEDYLWLCTMPPALIGSELRKAHAHGARELWVVNVGDIKPGEIGMEFFLRMSWNAEQWKEDAQPAFLSDWAARNFGSEYSAAIAAILDEYYRLNFPAKPEHLLSAEFSNNYQEEETRLKRFAAIVEKTDSLYQTIPASKKDAFYQLIVYPVRCAALMNQKYLGPDPSKAYAQIQEETRFFNEEISGGKWKHIMSSNPRKRPVFQKPTAAPAPAEAIETPSGEAGYVSLEAEQPTRATAGNGVSWKVISSLGRSGDSVTLLPTTAHVPGSAAMEYDFTAIKDGPATIQVHCIPTHAIHGGMKLRYSVEIGSGSPALVDLRTAEFSKQWAANVLRGAAIGTTIVNLTSGKHTLKLRPLDPGVIFDKIVIDFGGLKPSHLGPPTQSTP